MNPSTKNQHRDFFKEFQNNLIDPHDKSANQAEPRFWVLRQTKELPTSVDFATKTQLLLSIDEDVQKIHTVKELIDWLVENSTNRKLPLKYIKAFVDDDNRRQQLLNQDDYEALFTHYAREHWHVTNDRAPKDIYIADMRYEELDLIEDLHKYNANTIRVYGLKEYIMEIQTIIPNTLFLTKKEADDHIENNQWQYEKDVHPYEMTAPYSPRFNQLWNMLKNADFDNL